ncbi:PREDICTED: putative phosphatidylglycerol/phosphatidylinositol transfer protein 2 [Amphimedon queenslandica]|uniref:MD-2-related lipid-recognition domain-containing protein n=1 Tax=Amphimedon queenslandica TaxID=400682 RepID=A0A1X7UN49_AMPQE|nr:PREDICTED: putative phosphatidylglycerol/phosphatidylinositol transfer protein 2 [Amphimedon queenslandica]|eukprot:XP_011404560.1 PREDICTED: putative phosphatidylglycerol/phosphatidylinositol transfer protein 2 [Amphimedon queenslandica]
MKTILLFCALVAVLQASPLIDLKPAAPHPSLHDNADLGDIWSDCSRPGDPAKIKSVAIHPDPPQKDKPVSVNATITLSEEVTEGKITLVVKYGTFHITVINKSYDLCNIAKSAGDSCPLKTGDHNVIMTESLPGSAPSGSYKGNSEATDQNGKELVCINLNFKL